MSVERLLLALGVVNLLVLLAEALWHVVTALVGV